jgi:hypothetical protein
MASNSGILIPAAPLTNAIASTQDIRPIKPPVIVPSPWMWAVWSAGALLMVALVVAAVLATVVLRLRRTFTAPPPAHARARAAIDAALALVNNPRAFCTAVSDALRRYLEEHFRLRAPERTTEEFLRETQQTAELNIQQKENLGTFLEQCDLVKFARFEPTEAILRELHESALRLVHDTQYQPTEATRETAAAESARRGAELKRVFGQFTAIAGFLFQPFILLVVAAHYMTWLQLTGVVIAYQNAPPGFHASTFQWLKSAFNFLVANIWSVFEPVLPLAIPGLLLGTLGLAALVVALIVLKYRTKWFFGAVMLYALLLLGSAPLGTVLGVFFIAYCVSRRHEFSP